MQPRSGRRGNGSSGWAGSPNTGCGSSSPRSPPATRLWGDAMMTRLAEILRRDGDLGVLDIRRSKALGILITQPAEALHLLNSHHHDDDDPAQSPEPDLSPEPDEDHERPDRCPELVEGSDAASATADAMTADLALRQAQGAGSDVAVRQAQGAGSDAALRQAQGAGTRSLRIGPPPFDPAKARPRAVVYVHISEEALRAGTRGGAGRGHRAGAVVPAPQVLGTRCQIQLKPVIDLNDEPAPVDCYEIPARIAEHLRLRQPMDVFPYAAGGSRRTDLDHTIPIGPRIRAGRRVRPGSGNSGRTSATTTESKPTASGTCDNPNPAAGSGGRLTDASTWSTAVVPTRSATADSPNESGAPPKHHHRLIRAIRPRQVRSRQSCAPIWTHTS